MKRNRHRAWSAAAAFLILCLVVPEVRGSLCFGAGAQQCEWCHILPQDVDAQTGEALVCGQQIGFVDTPAPATAAPTTNASQGNSTAGGNSTGYVLPLIVPLATKTCVLGHLGLSDRQLTCKDDDRQCEVRATPWSACSAECGGGRQGRNVTASPLLNSQIQLGSDQYAAHCEKEDVVKCNRRPCGELGRTLKVSTLPGFHVTKRPYTREVPWGGTPQKDLPTPIVFAPLESDGLRLAFSSGSGEVTVLGVNGSDHVVSTETYSDAAEVRGLTQTGILLLNSDGELRLSYDNATQAVPKATIKTGPPNGVVNAAIGRTRLIEARYSVKNNVTGTSENTVMGVFSASYDDARPSPSERGDFEYYYDYKSEDASGDDRLLPSTKMQSLFWRCAPSSGHRMIYHKALNMAITACVSASNTNVEGGSVIMYPSGVFGEQASGNASSGARKGRCCLQDGVIITSAGAARIGTELGSLVATPTGVLLVYTMGQGDIGSTDWKTAILNQNGHLRNKLMIAEAELSSDWQWRVKRHKEIVAQDAEASKSMPQLAEIRQSGELNYLLGWATDGSDFKLARLNADLEMLGTEESVGEWAAWGDSSDWVTTSEGTVAWVYSWNFEWDVLGKFADAASSLVKIVRVNASYATEIDDSKSLRCQGQSNGTSQQANGACSESYVLSTAVPDAEESMSAIVIAIIAVCSCLLVLKVVWLVKRRRTRVVGNTSRVRRFDDYPWEQPGRENELEFMDFPKL